MAQVNNHGSWWMEVSNTKLTMVVVTLSVISLAILWYKLTLSSSTKGAPSLPPGPRSLPIVGYLPFIGRDLHKKFTIMAHNYGPIFKFYLGSKLHVVVNTPELAKEVFRDQDDTFANHDLTTAASVLTYGGQDIVWSKNNSYWRNLRKILVHEVLSNKNLEACSFFRSDEVRKNIKNVFSKVGTAVNISEISYLTQTNVLIRMVWQNYSDKGEKDTALGAELQKVSSKITELLGHPNLSDFFPSIAWFDIQGVERDMKKLQNKLNEIFERIIEDRIKSNSKKSSHDEVESEQKRDLLDVLLELKEKTDATSLDINQIKAILMNFIVVGADAPTKLVEWTMTTIMQNPNVMKRIQEELTEIVGLNNQVEESHLSKLVYLDATVKETFRFLPVVPLLVPRSPSRTCIVGGYTIPKGCTLLVNVWSIHRDPLYWENPLEFNPDRFLQHDGINKWDYNGNNMKFLPFGSGRRVCPGIPLAGKMQKFILASLLHSFDWSFPEGEKDDLSHRLDITLTRKNPLVALPSPRLLDERLYM